MMTSALVGASSAGLELESVKELIGMVKECLSLFSVYPLNILLLLGIMGGAFVLFKKARGATGAPA